MPVLRLAGRETEVGLLDDALAAVAAGLGGAVLLEGEAGIGKTALLDHAAAAATSLGLTVRRGAADPLDDLRPCGCLLDALDPEPDPPPAVAAAARALARVRRSTAIEAVEPTSPLRTATGRRGRLVDAVAALAEAWARRPVVVVLDDLHVTEPTTHTALARLLRIATVRPLLLLAAYRPVPRDHALVALARRVADGGGRVVVVGPLDREAARAVLGAAATGQRPADLDTAVDSAGGNPFLLGELARALSGGTGARHAGVVDRMVTLGPSARGLLRVAALLGPVVSVDELAVATARPVADLLPDLDEAVAAGLLVADGEHHRFRHDLVREAVEAGVAPQVRAAAHRDIGRRLAAAGATPQRRAAHLLRGAQPGDVTAVAELHRAGVEVLAESPATAVQLLERAAELCLPSARDAVLVDLVEARTWAGQAGAAVDLAGELLRRPAAPPVPARLHAAAALGLLLLGRPAEALAHAAQVPGTVSGRAGWGSALAALIRVVSLDLDGAVAAAREALADHPDPWAETLALEVLGWVDVVRGHHVRAIEHCDAAVRAADRSERGCAHRLLPHLLRGLALLACRRPDEASASLARGRELGDALGVAWAAPFHHYAEAVRHGDVGAWDDLLAECGAGLRHAAAHGVWLAAPFGYAAAAGVHLLRGDTAEAGRFLDRGDELLARGGPQLGLDQALWIRALHVEAVGDPETALVTLTAAWQGARGMHAGAALSLLAPDLVRLALGAGLRGTAEAALADLRASDGDRPSVDLTVLRCEGLLTADPAPILEAGRRRGPRPGPIDVALDAEALLLVALARGDRPAAAAALQECLDVCDASEVRLVAQRARRAAAAQGLTARARPGRPAHGLGALTATERRVAELVSLGQSNPEIAAELVVSRRTVESHLYRVFAKLDVRNRTELALTVRGDD